MASVPKPQRYLYAAASKRNLQVLILRKAGKPGANSKVLCLASYLHATCIASSTGSNTSNDTSSDTNSDTSSVRGLARD